jgi:hypothetical protein
MKISNENNYTWLNIWFRYYFNPLIHLTIHGCIIHTVARLCARSSSRGARIRNPHGSPWGVGVPQALSCVSANIVVSKASPGESHQ